MKTPNRQEAANKARTIYRHIVTEGWDSALQEFKGVKVSTIRADITTIGDFLRGLTATDITPKRQEGYSLALRSIVAGLLGVPRVGRGGNRQDASNLKSRVHNAPLSILTPASINQWKKDYLSSYPDDPASQRRAKISVNSLLRRAKSLFSKRYLEQVPLLKGISNPFAEVRFEKRQSQRYRSSFDIYALIKAAKDELREQHPEQFKVFILASMAGLRRGEIDSLLWEQIRFAESVIRIETTKYHHPKSEFSSGDIEVDLELLAVLKEMKTSREFVIESDATAKPDALTYVYRCSAHFDKLSAWLKSKGVEGNKPLHQLRKEFGSLLADQHGIYTASRMLRHSDISVTANHYLDKKTRRTVGLGAHL